MFRRNGLWLVMGLCVVLLNGCQKKAAEEISYGSFSDSVYRNDFFGLAITIPATWNVQSKAALAKLSETGSKMVSGDDKTLQARLDAAKERSLNLFAAFEHPQGAPVDFNSSILSAAEVVSDQPGIKRGSDYLFHARKLFETGQLKYDIAKGTQTETLGGVQFDVLQMTMLGQPVTINQKYYVTIKNGYALIFIVTFDSPEREQQLNEILKTVTFAKG